MSFSCYFTQHNSERKSQKRKASPGQSREDRPRFLSSDTTHQPQRETSTLEFTMIQNLGS